MNVDSIILSSLLRASPLMACDQKNDPYAHYFMLVKILLGGGGVGGGGKRFRSICEKCQ